jgi:imidazolonepropionase-like amidohydrolase
MMAEAVADIVRAGGKASLGGHGEQVGLDTHWEMWVYASALTPMETLEVASLGGAYMAGLEDDLGSIEVGKLADLVVLNSNPLQDIRRTTDIRFVMKGGILYDGDTLDEVWPTARPYGPYPWADQEIYRSDVRPDEYWDRPR